MTPLQIIALIPLYLIGAFPTGYLIGRAKGVDIRKEGSGNVGATNVARAIGKSAGVMTLLGDVGKGIVGMLVASILSSDANFRGFAACVIVLGHCFSIPGVLKGGKGVATALGVFLIISPISALCGLGVFGIVVAVSKMVSLGSISAALAIPLAAMLINENSSTVFALIFIGLLSVYRHKENIIRIIEGREKSFNAPKE